MTKRDLRSIGDFGVVIRPPSESGKLCARAQYTSSFAPCLGKIGHTVCGDQSRTHAGELCNLISQVGLVEISEFCRSTRRVVRRSFHALQQRLKPPESGQALCRNTPPVAHKAIQLARTDPTRASEVRDGHLARAILDFLECALNAGVNLRPDDSLHEELFQRVEPLIERLHIG